jgi:hypothetical protein
VIAPSRGITTTLQPQRALHLRRRHLDIDIRFLFGLRRLQQQLGREIPMQSRLPPWSHYTNEARRVL